MQSLNTEQALEKLNAMLQNNASDDFQPSEYSQSSSSSSSSKGSDWGASNTRGFPKNFNPATAHFTEDELKPTPITRKAQKKLVKAELKEELLSVKEELQTLKEKILVIQMHTAAAGKQL